ncbi:hypothetical protein [Pelagibius sp.]|uniref:hypothetical protein n=1 Tax=Pelagibius sp. TaxID=1931238 RepID=UPI0026038DE1|nr:hypothetical protein [Pelagibius sp.]
MFAAQATLLTMASESLLRPLGKRPAHKPQRQDRSSLGLDDPSARLLAALAEMLPSTLDEIADAAEVERTTAEAYLARMSARCEVMFNPLTKRYSLPRTAAGSTFAA